MSAWDALRAALARAGAPAAAEEALRRLAALLAEAGARQNLTRIAGHEDFVEKHALDALLGLEALGDPGRRVVDVGSGGGVPGIPLALARPAWHVTLIESEGRKVDFLGQAVAALELVDRVAVVKARAEHVGQDPVHREGWDAAVARALGAVPVVLELTLPLVRVGGRVVLYRGPSNAEQELEEARRVAPQLGGGEPSVLERALPSGAARRLIVVEKVAPTPARYPRKPGIPAKRPLS